MQYSYKTSFLKDPKEGMMNGVHSASIRGFTLLFWHSLRSSFSGTHTRADKYDTTIVLADLPLVLARCSLRVAASCLLRVAASIAHSWLTPNHWSRRTKEWNGMEVEVYASRGEECLSCD